MEQVVRKKLKPGFLKPEVPSSQFVKMSTITAQDVLNARDKHRKSGVIAHSPNSRGEFMARFGCSCYNCRDALDPTGEEDAARANNQESNKPSNVLPFSLGPSSSSYPSFNTGIGLLRSPSTGGTSTTAHLSLLSPPPLIRASRAEPDHIKDAIASLKLEIEKLKAKQDDVYESEASSHSDMAAQDMEWNELDAKIVHFEKVIQTLEADGTSSSTKESDLMDGLRGLRSKLQLEQDDLCDNASADEATRRTLEMRDEEITRKIAAIETLLLSFGCIFRHR